MGNCMIEEPLSMWPEYPEYGDPLEDFTFEEISLMMTDPLQEVW